ncbi:MAG TPA: GNAT family protein, partial [Candidatus Dormibacteraeota bacterium]|nr:GNAT family protein [Candidatus Dormibacteraeota bacterium]
GRGLVTRSVAALVDLAFGPLGLHRVELRAATRNARSRAVAERLGLVHEGTLRDAELLASGHVDLEIYSVLSTEWPSAEG